MQIRKKAKGCILRWRTHPRYSSYALFAEIMVENITISKSELCLYSCCLILSFYREIFLYTCAIRNSALFFEKQQQKQINTEKEFISEPYMSALPCEQGKAAAKDSYEIQLTHQQLSFSLLP